MKQSVKFIVTPLVLIFLGNVTAEAQSRSGELGRGFPYKSGDEWSWGPWIFVLFLIFVLSLAGVVKDKLVDQSWWHTVIVVTATLLLSLWVTATISRPYPADLGLAVFMLMPSFVCIALLYLATMRVTRSRHD
jgi:hypothetical protein